MNLRETIATHDGEVVLRLGEQTDQFWLVPFSASQLEEWWRAQESFDFDPDGIHDMLCRQFGEPPRSLPRTREFPGRFIDAEYPEGGELWKEMADSKKHYICELCCDGDSYLKRPDGTRIYHRGYKAD